MKHRENLKWRSREVKTKKNFQVRFGWGQQVVIWEQNTTQSPKSKTNSPWATSQGCNLKVNHCLLQRVNKNLQITTYHKTVTVVYWGQMCISTRWFWKLMLPEICHQKGPFCRGYWSFSMLYSLPYIYMSTGRVTHCSRTHQCKLQKRVLTAIISTFNTC